MPFSIHDLLVAGPQKSEGIAIKSIDGRSLSYAGLRKQIRDVVAGLNSLGFTKNDRIMLLLRNGPKMAVAFLSVAAGFTCVPLNPSITRDEFAICVSVLSLRAMIVGRGVNVPVVEAAMAVGIRVIELQPLSGDEAGLFRLDVPLEPDREGGVFAGEDDIALVIFTSGSTAKPKAVPLTQSNLCHCATSLTEGFGFTEKDCSLNLMPLHYIQGLSTSLLTMLVAGGTVVCTPGFDERRVIGWLNEYRPTFYSVVPAVHAKIAAQAAWGDEKLWHSPRVIRSAGAPLDPGLRRNLEAAFGVPIRESYGMTECPIIALPSAEAATIKVGSVGKPAGVEVAVADGDGKFLDPGKTGEVLIRGPGVIRGYLNDPAANRSSFSDGWLRTGDLGLLDSDGFLYIKGRIKELINRGGEKISPYEVEEVIRAYPGVAEAVVFRVPGGDNGEEVGAAVVPVAGHSVSEQDLKAFISTRLSYYKVPSRIVFPERIPTIEVSGKYQRARMADLLGLTARPEPAEKPAYRPPESEVEKKLTGIWEESLGVRRVGLHDDFFALDGDSVKAAALLSAVYGIFKVNLPLNTIIAHPTIGSMARLITDDEAGVRISSALTLLRPGGTRPPLFCMHGVNGGLMKYQDVIECLDRGRPVIGIQPADVVKDDPLDSIESMAAFYVRAMRSVQPTGPYHILGHSFSGSLAYETARQLESEGEKIGFLGIVDHPAPGQDFWKPDKVYSMSMMKVLLKESPKIAGKFLASDNGTKAAGLANAARLTLKLGTVPFRRLSCMLPFVTKPADRTVYMKWVFEIPEHLRDYALQNRDRMLAYRPAKFSQKVTLFPAISRDNLDYLYRLQDPTMGWRRLAAEIESIPLDGDHVSVLKMPYARRFAEKIDECMERSGRAPDRD